MAVLSFWGWRRVCKSINCGRAVSEIKLPCSRVQRERSCFLEQAINKTNPEALISIPFHALEPETLIQLEIPISDKRGSKGDCVEGNNGRSCKQSVWIMNVDEIEDRSGPYIMILAPDMILLQKYVSEA